MPKPKQTVFLYNHKGEYLKKFSSISEFASEYGLQENIFCNKSRGQYSALEQVILLPDTNIASTYRIGREGIRKWLAYKNNKFVGKGKEIALGALKNHGKMHKVQVFDLDGDLMATFENEYFAKIFIKPICDFPNSGNVKNGSTYPNKEGLLIKFNNLP